MGKSGTRSKKIGEWEKNKRPSAPADGDPSQAAAHYVSKANIIDA
ncbi:MAG: hypothetical protein ACR2OT_05975 [Parvibaculales bacterium]